MRVILIPHQGDAYFGDPIPDEKVGQPIVKLAPNQAILATFDPTAPNQIVQIENYEYKGTIVKRGGQPIIAFYEQA